MRVLIVEDNPDQVEWLCSKLSVHFKPLEIDVISAESDFRDRLPLISGNPPDVVIMDVMLRWTTPGPGKSPRPDNVVGQSFYEAGLRCQKLLTQHEPTRKIPVILYTVLNKSEISEDVDVLTKGSDELPLIERIRDATGTVSQGAA